MRRLGSRARWPAHRRRGGFILLDSLAAFAVLSVTLGTTLVGIAIAMRADARAAITRSAIRFAHARLATIGTDDALEPGRTQGSEADGLRWRIEVVPLARRANERVRGAPVQAATNAPGATPYWVSISVTTAEGGILEFGTVKLDRGRAP